jgi:hypothetical protein
VWLAKSSVVPDEERPQFLKQDFLKRVSAFDPVAVLPKLAGRRVRLSQFEKSASVPEEARKKIAAALPSTAARQQLMSPAQIAEMAESKGNTVHWMKNQLKGSEPQSARRDGKKPGSASMRSTPAENFGLDRSSN